MQGLLTEIHDATDTKYNYKYHRCGESEQKRYSKLKEFKACAKTLFGVWRAQKMRACNQFVQSIEQTKDYRNEARPLLLCLPYLKSLSVAIRSESANHKPHSKKKQTKTKKRKEKKRKENRQHIGP